VNTMKMIVIGNLPGVRETATSTSTTAIASASVASDTAGTTKRATTKNAASASAGTSAMKRPTRTGSDVGGGARRGRANVDQNTVIEIENVVTVIVNAVAEITEAGTTTANATASENESESASTGTATVTDRERA